MFAVIGNELGQLRILDEIVCVSLWIYVIKLILLSQQAISK